jgi:hypothetical protein
MKEEVKNKTIALITKANSPNVKICKGSVIMVNMGLIMTFIRPNKRPARSATFQFATINQVGNNSPIMRKHNQLEIMVISNRRISDPPFQIALFL